MSDAAADRRAAIMTAVCSAGLMAIGLGAGSHMNSDDALYAQMAREMLVTGDLIDNRWAGVVHFEKPPLLLWLLALSGGLLGFGEAALRLPITLLSAIALGCLVWVGRGLGLPRRAAVTAAALTGSGGLYLLMTRRLMTDVPLVALSLAAAAALMARRYLLCGLCAGLAILAKGAAAAPLLLCLMVYGLLQGLLPLRALGKVVGIAALVATPWHLVSSLRHGGDFWMGYLGHHVFERLTVGVVPGLSTDQLLGVLALDPLLLVGAAAGLFAFLRAPGAHRSALRFTLLWIGLTVLPLLGSATVLPHYLLPLTPAFALLTVAAVPARLWQSPRAIPIAGACVLIALLATPDKLIWWLDADLGPDEKTLGSAIGDQLEQGDVVGAYNVTNASLVFHCECDVPIYTDDPTFLAVQRAVLMNQRQGNVFDLAERALPVPEEGRRRFVVARAQPDLPRLLARMHAAAPQRPLFVMRAGALVLVNDAGVGQPAAAAAVPR